ncbi:etoposide-induced protein 2.4-domain-containing protein [Cantharellus anzutake]|uniref:etoposide-induced protein 2.4-domain-containing protein n=1 Tax=Cantharellus anzutake TaxID=1750568 RepID=UPI00190408EC|nr:etoposide-induced protein 2.4-domain-containing protein [Cantharellus anzutake]KAF8326001.1 etoposide-induced protein 2.4-domain-containing protein [Cantharellus anzutake]
MAFQPSAGTYLSVSYANFFGGDSVLSFTETAKLHAKWASNGLIDSSRWDVVYRVVVSDAEIRANVLKSAVLNTLSLVVIYTFDILFLPILGRSTQERWLHRNIGSLYQVLFQLPVVGMSLYLNSTWGSVVAKRVYALQYGRAAVEPSPSSSGIMGNLAAQSFRGILILSTILVTILLSYLPVLGPFQSFVLMCWVDAYYCFEYVWVAQGFSLSRRVRFQEERWSYFFGFGFALSALCMWGSSIANATLFALLFPLYVIMAIHARPLPTYPQAPAPPITNYATTEERSLKPNPLIPIRLPVLTGPVLLNDFFLSLVGARGTRGGKKMGIIGREVDIVDDGDGGILMEEGTGGWIGIRRGAGSPSSAVGRNGFNFGIYDVQGNAAPGLRPIALHTRVRGKKLD